jgi:hypothetical protein
MKELAKGLILNISMEEGDPECVVLSLTNTVSHGTIVHRHEVGTGTLDRIYHRREAIVIGMRQLVAKAIDQKLISITSHGESMMLNTATTGLDKSTISSTDWGF